MLLAIVWEKTNKSVLYLDDISFARSGNVKETIISDETTATFTEGFDTKYVKTYTYDGINKLSVNDVDSVKMDDLYTKFTLVSDPKNTANQVLRAVNQNGSASPGYTHVGISNANPTGNCYTLEMKMYIDKYTATYGLTLINFVDANGKVILNTQTTVNNSSNVTLSTTKSSYPVSTDLIGGKVKVAPKQWFTLRIEYYHAGEDSTEKNSYLKVYVNDTLTYSDIAYTAVGYAIDHVELVVSKTNKTSVVLYDDITFTRTDKSYTK